jgi:glycolate oxidase
MDECDVVVPRDSIAEFVRKTVEIGQRLHVRIRSFGHAGDGNLHIYCCSNDLEEDEFKRRVKLLMDACYAKCTEFDGQVSGEHSIGHAKKEYLRESVGDTAYGLMGAIKDVFDPWHILNPGKVCHTV